MDVSRSCRGTIKWVGVAIKWIEWQSQKPIFVLFCLCFLNSKDVSCTCYSYFILHHQVNLFSFYNFSTSCLFIEQYGNNCSSRFLKCYLGIYYVNIKYFCMYKRAYLVFPSVYLELVYQGWLVVLQHINTCRLFDAKSCLFIYFFSSYVWKHVQYPALISCQPGVITQFW